MPAKKSPAKTSKTKSAPASKPQKAKPPSLRLAKVASPVEAPTTVEEPQVLAPAEPVEPAPVEVAPVEPGATKTRKATAEAGSKKLSALDAAAKVLAEAREPLNCQEMIERMALKGYWSSPGGKTPAATLYSAIIRELATKGDEARFRKTNRGMFIAKSGGEQ